MKIPFLKPSITILCLLPLATACKSEVNIIRRDPITSGLPAPSPSSPTTPAPTTAPSPGPGNHLLTIARSGSGTVSSSPAGIHCGASCSASFTSGADGAVVTLTATPATGYYFAGWGGACSGTAPTCTVTLKTARTANATFQSNTSVGDTIDAVIASMPSNSWKSLPSTQMRDVCPPGYPSFACWAVVGAWSGGLYDEKRDRMIIHGGGHYDSWYNNIFAFDLTTMKWQRLSEMPEGAGKTPPPGWNDKRLESCGYYPKGALSIPDTLLNSLGYVKPENCWIEPVLSQIDFQQPRSAHTYGGMFHDRVKDLYCTLSGGGYPSAQTGSKPIKCFEPASGLWTRIADRPDLAIYGRGQAAPDSRGHAWVLPADNSYLAEYDPHANAWKTYGFINYEAGGGADIDRKRDQFYVLFPLTGGTYALKKWDLANPATLTARPSHSTVATTGDLPTNLGSRPGFVYADGLDKIFAWGGGRDLHIFDPATAVWTRVSATGDDPGLPQTNGTYGRFRYSSARGVIVLVNDTSQNVFIYKP